MARDYSPYQRKVIQRYYQNADAIQAQQLSELVTEIYLATTPKRQDKLWERAAKLLLVSSKSKGASSNDDAEGTEARAAIQAVLDARDVEALAELAGQRAR